MSEALSHAQTPAVTKTTPATVLRNRNFRLLRIGEGVSLLGDQFFTLFAAFSRPVRAGLEP